MPRSATPASEGRSIAARDEVETRDVAPGLWLWRQRHWEWREGDDWEPQVSSWVVESGGEIVLIDPLAPPPNARQVYDRLEQRRPTAIVVLKPDHVRDVDLFVHWYGVPAYGPWMFWRNDVPKTEMTAIRPDDVLPGGLVALYDGREAMETPLYLPESQTPAPHFAGSLRASFLERLSPTRTRHTASDKVSYVCHQGAATGLDPRWLAP